ncbi:MAG: ATP-binding protein [Lachnospiraceae bacterium]|nr:ATP-binding protein [Lachnospiraceae bacterium]
MLPGRETELKALSGYYDRVGSQVMVIYGQKGVGKTTMIEDFLEDKSYLYYEAVSCSTRQQMFYLGKHLNDMGFSLPEYPDFEEVFNLFSTDTIKKQVLVIDEFHNFCKTDTLFFDALLKYLTDEKEKRSIFVILTSSAMGWVENTMAAKLGDFSKVITDHLKVKELSYRDFTVNFPGFSSVDSIGAYAVLGGVPGLWQYFNDEFSLRENIESFILQSNEKLFDYGQQYVAEELRETSVYNTILAALAEGKNKLNDLYRHTGFSRAKISVYLKNLIQLEIVEKVSSMETEGKENAQKGIYRISHAYVHFYYRFLFPYQNKLSVLEADEFYEEYIEPDFRQYTADYFVKVCRQFLARENAARRLPFEYTRMGQWIGKTGNIDFLMEDEEKNRLAGICSWEKDMLTYADYEWLLFTQKQAKIHADFMILFSAARFDQALHIEAKKNPRLALLTADQLKNN